MNNSTFVCKCEGHPGYGGWFNGKKCKTCNATIRNMNGVRKGGYAWKTQRIKNLEDRIDHICSLVDLEWNGLITRDELVRRLSTLASEGRKDIEENKYKSR